MGHLVRQGVGREQGVVYPLPSASSSLHSFPEVLEGWVGLVEAAAVPEQTPVMRLAALQSVRASGLLTQLRPRNTSNDIIDWQGPFLVRVLFTISLLAQDDEDDVREAARAALAENTTIPTIPPAVAARSSPATPCLDLLAGRALAQLAARNPAAAREWTRAVVQFVVLRTQGLATTLEETITPPCLGLPQQIFRPEPDNVYEEQAVVCYWTMRSLLVALAKGGKEEEEGVGVGSSSSSLLKGGEGVEVEGLFALQKHAGLLARAYESSAWIGGLTNHPYVFSKIFAAALGGMLGAVLLTLPAGGGSDDDNAVLLKVLEERATDHPLMAWALRSLRVILMRMKSWGGGDSVQARARMVLETVDWEVVEKYAPFVRPSL